MGKSQETAKSRLIRKSNTPTPDAAMVTKDIPAAGSSVEGEGVGAWVGEGVGVGDKVGVGVGEAVGLGEGDGVGEAWARRGAEVGREGEAWGISWARGLLSGAVGATACPLSR